MSQVLLNIGNFKITNIFNLAFNKLLNNYNKYLLKQSKWVILKNEILIYIFLIILFNF